MKYLLAALASLFILTGCGKEPLAPMPKNAQGSDFTPLKISANQKQELAPLPKNAQGSDFTPLKIKPKKNG